MIHLTDEQLKKLQSVELEMLIEFDRICRKHQIKYTLDGGTLLGAIRHNGFIPWDDDADLIMLREEYDKFRAVCEKELDTDRFFFQEWRTDPYYRWGHSKFRRKDSLFLREGQEAGKWHQGIFIDIFIMDNVSDLFLLRRIQWLLCLCVRKCLYSEVGKISAKSKALRIWYSFLNRIPRDTLFSVIEGISMRNNKKRTTMVTHFLFPYRKECRYGMPRECFDTYVEKDFEGHSFSIIEKYDLYMKRLYGDYMTLPPEQDRKVHPVSQIRFPGDMK